MDKDVNIVSKSNDLGKASLDALSDVNAGPLANALRQHINEYYNVNKETSQQDDRQDQSTY